MVDDLKEFIKKIDEFQKLKPSQQIDFFAYFLIIEQKQSNFTHYQIEEAFKHLRLIPYSNIPQYLIDNSNNAKKKKKTIRFIKTKEGFHFVSPYETELLKKIKNEEVPFLNFSVDFGSLEWKPSDVPFINSKIRKNAEFFSKMYFLLYHLENSIRKFLSGRLNSIIGTDWELKLMQTVDLNKAVAIRNESNLSEMIQDRGDSILYYCMWDDYAKIIKQYPKVFFIAKECDEVLAHLNSMGKIRNAIAHNTATIPKEYQEELTLFLKKYIKIMKSNGASS